MAGRREGEAVPYLPQMTARPDRVHRPAFGIGWAVLVLAASA
jgi:hypothetical protein